MIEQVTTFQWAIAIIVTVIMGFMTIILSGMSKSLVKIGDRLSGVETKVAGLETRMDGFDSRMNGFESRMNGFEAKLEKLSSAIVDLRVDFGILLGSLNGPLAFSAVPRRLLTSDNTADSSLPDQGSPADAGHHEPRPE
ncbi:MAG: hypothetical protein LBR80_07140 [Deltaproteobacteria bacterium]|jgi:hypothetical protein|nr:hypothetical protein [Deltaproteobacteria bacterium]